jgi:hypothetical protein
MLVAVVEDIREHVFPGLHNLVQQIKQQITEEEEIIWSTVHGPRSTDHNLW